MHAEMAAAAEMRKYEDMDAEMRVCRDADTEIECGDACGDADAEMRRYGFADADAEMWICGYA